MKKYNMHFIMGINTPDGFVVNEKNDWYEEHTAESLKKLLDEDFIDDDLQELPLNKLTELLEGGSTCVLSEKEVHSDSYKTFIVKDPKRLRTERF